MENMIQNIGDRNHIINNNNKCLNKINSNKLSNSNIKCNHNIIK